MIPHSSNGTGGEKEPTVTATRVGWVELTGENGAGWLHELYAMHYIDLLHSTVTWLRRRGGGRELLLQHGEEPVKVMRRARNVGGVLLKERPSDVCMG